MTKAILGAFVTAIVLKLFFFDFMVAEGHSMEPAIHDGSVLVVNKLQYGLRFPGQSEYLVRWAAPRPGEVVIFYAPSGGVAVKRIAALSEKGTLMVQGDNSLLSYDSRSYGPVPLDSTIGRVLGVR
jgi:signal peptidase I